MNKETNADKTIWFDPESKQFIGRGLSTDHLIFSKEKAKTMKKELIMNILSIVFSLIAICLSLWVLSQRHVKWNTIDGEPGMAAYNQMREETINRNKGKSIIAIAKASASMLNHNAGCLITQNNKNVNLLHVH